MKNFLRFSRLNRLFTPTLTNSTRKYVGITSTILASTALFSSVIVLAADSTQHPTKSTEHILEDNQFDNFIPPNRSGSINTITEREGNTHVQRLIASNAMDILLNPKMNVILKLFATNCHNCRNLGFVYDIIAEEYEKLIHEMKLENTFAPVIFTEMNGEQNYIRGLIDVANEGRFPHIVALPYGTTKVTTFKKAEEMNNTFAKYHNPLLIEELKKTVQNRSNADMLVRDAESEKISDKNKPTFDRKDIPVVGTFWTLKWGPGKTIVDGLLDFIFNNTVFIPPTTSKSSPKSTTENNNNTSIIEDFEKKLRQRMADRLPEIKERVLEAAKNEYMDAHDKATTGDPCGVYLDAAYRNFYTASMGLSDPISSSLFMTEYRKCVWENEEEVKKYYMNIKKHIDFVENCYSDKEEWLEQDKTVREFYADAVSMINQK